MMFDSSESQRLKFARSIAVCLIIITHISQEYKTSLGQWTNTGVQIFLVISGFIWGQRVTIKWSNWAFRRFIRIIPSYYIILIITAIAYWAFAQTNIIDLQYASHFTTLHFLVYPNFPFWGGHLWYITALVVCYAIFPVLHVSKRITPSYFLAIYLIIVPSLLLIIFYKTTLPYGLSGCIYCFILGFAVAHLFRDKPPLYLAILSAFLSVIILVGEQVAVSKNYWNISLIETSVNLLWPWKKCLFGLSVFLLLYLPLFNKLSNNVVVNFIDKYSYEIYLAHKNFILGTLSLLYVSNLFLFNIFISIVCSLICAFLVNKLSLPIQENLITKLNTPPNTVPDRVKTN